MMFNSREAIVKAIEEIRKTEREEEKNIKWSDPMYPCPKCGGGMRMNMFGGRVLTTLPPIRQCEYQCDNCGFIDFI